ncbi:MAG TPA: hypothetical protein VNX65_03455 [Patescibacteria group bacterium]|nr:hypothetical protein [Patescibacteria group bacterium]
MTTTDDGYRYPVSDTGTPALTWSELAPGTYFALVDTPAHIEPSSGAVALDQPVEMLRAMVVGATFAYVNRTGSLRDWPTGTLLANLACGDGTLRTITSRQWGFSPVRVEDGIEVHGTCYCTPLG